MGVGAGTRVSESGEKVALHRLRSTKPAPWTVFDVGANVGQFLQLLCNTLPPDQLNVHSFEPGTAAFKALTESATHLQCATLNNFALGIETCTAELFFDQPGSGLASMAKRRLDHFGIDFSQSETIQVTTVDDYCLKNNIETIDLLKMDVEGLRTRCPARCKSDA